jgi:hypothetical protein
MREPHFDPARFAHRPDLGCDAAKRRPPNRGALAASVSKLAEALLTF